MSSYKGQFLVAVDNKGRVAIPAKLRSRSGESTDFVLTKGLEGCLALYPSTEWKKIVDSMSSKMSNLPFTPEKYRFYERDLYGNAEDVTPDKQGRILIPDRLLKLAKIDREARVVGVAARIEIWNPGIYEKYVDEYEKSPEEVAESLSTQIE